jgi:hypothetical protein
MRIAVREMRSPTLCPARFFQDHPFRICRMRPPLLSMLAGPVKRHQELTPRRHEELIPLVGMVKCGGLSFRRGPPRWESR